MSKKSATIYIVAAMLVALSGQAWANFTAYNDCVYQAGQNISPNVTTVGLGESGKLLAFNKGGAVTGVTVSITHDGSCYAQPDKGFPAQSGTEADNMFSGIADIKGMLHYGSPGWWVELKFAGLDPNKEYSFTTTLNKGYEGFADRVTLFSIIGAKTYKNASTAGITNSLSSHNTVNGYVVRWTEITAPNGTLTIRAQAHPDAEKAYGFSVFEFKETTSKPKKEVEITVDAKAIQGKISPMINGFNMSYWHDTDQLWADGKIADSLRKLRVGILRYPGGEKTSYFHWEHTGVPVYHDIWEPDPNCSTWYRPQGWYADASKYAADTNHMDTDEFIGWCRKIGAEPVIGINIESGIKHNRQKESLEEALRWMRYCKERNYNVKYWYIDNETYHGEPYNYKQLSVDEYIEQIKKFSQAMKKVDPSIKIIIAWHSDVDGFDDEWTKLIRQAGPYFDIADAHWYWDWGLISWDTWINQSPILQKNQWNKLPAYITFAEQIKRFHKKTEKLGQSHIRMASLEWNIGIPDEGKSYPSMFQSALIQSEILGQFIEGGLEMACMWPLNWDPGFKMFPSVLDHTTYQPTPAYEAFKMYSRILGHRLLKSETNLAHVRPVAALSDDGNCIRVYLLHKSGEGKTINVRLNTEGFEAINAKAVSLTADKLSSDKGELKKLNFSLNPKTGELEGTLPPHSLTMVTIYKDEKCRSCKDKTRPKRLPAPP